MNEEELITGTLDNDEPSHILRIGPFRFRQLEKWRMSWLAVATYCTVPFMGHLTLIWNLSIITSTPALYMTLSPLFILSGIIFLYCVPLALLCVLQPAIPFRSFHAALFHDIFHNILHFLAPHIRVVRQIQQYFPDWEEYDKNEMANPSCKFTVRLIRLAYRVFSDRKMAMAVLPFTKDSVFPPVPIMTLVDGVIADKLELSDGCISWRSAPLVRIQSKLAKLNTRMTLTMIQLAIHVIDKEWGGKTSLPSLLPKDSAPVSAVCCIVELLRVHNDWNQLPTDMRKEFSMLCYQLLCTFSKTCRSNVEFNAKENTSGFVIARISALVYMQYLQRFDEPQDMPIDLSG